MFKLIEISAKRNIVKVFEKFKKTTHLFYKTSLSLLYTLRFIFIISVQKRKVLKSLVVFYRFSLRRENRHFFIDFDKKTKGCIF